MLPGASSFSLEAQQRQQSTAAPNKSTRLSRHQVLQENLHDVSCHFSAFSHTFCLTFCRTCTPSTVQLAAAAIAAAVLESSALAAQPAAAWDEFKAAVNVGAETIVFGTDSQASMQISALAVLTIDWGNVILDVARWNVWRDMADGQKTATVTLLPENAVEHLSFGLADEARTVHGKPYAYDVMLVEPSDGTYTFTPPPPSPLEHRRQSSLRAPMTSIQGSMPDSSFKSPRCCFSMRSRASSLSRICF